MFTMRQPLSGLQTVGVVVGVLFSLLSLSRLTLAITALLCCSSSELSGEFVLCLPFSFDLLCKAM